jgi:hypothetical protein
MKYRDEQTPILSELEDKVFLFPILGSDRLGSQIPGNAIIIMNYPLAGDEACPPVARCYDLCPVPRK